MGLDVWWLGKLLMLSPQGGFSDVSEKSCHFLWRASLGLSCSATCRGLQRLQAIIQHIAWQPLSVFSTKLRVERTWAIVIRDFL